MKPSHTFHDCCNAILQDPGRGANFQFAKAYAKTGLAMPDALTRDGARPNVRTQVLYILANITGWRGETARAVRQALKHFGGIK